MKNVKEAVEACGWLLIIHGIVFLLLGLVDLYCTMRGIQVNYSVYTYLAAVLASVLITLGVIAIVKSKEELLEQPGDRKHN